MNERVCCGTQVDWKEVETRGTIYSKMENDALEQIGVHLDKESRLEQTDKEQPLSSFLRPRWIGTELSHDVLNPARVPL